MSIREELIERVKQLPPLNMVVQQLLEVVNNPNTSASEVTAILSSDQAIASKVLALVNSSFYGFPSKISTVSRAVVILGNKSIQSLALSFAALDYFKNYQGELDIDQFWEHGLATAIGAQLLAKADNYPLPEEAFIGGLLHDVGQLILAIEFPDEYETVINSRFEFCRSEKKCLKLTHCDAGQLLMQHWKLPPVLLEAIRYHHSVENSRNQLARYIALADIMSEVIGMGSLEYLSLAELEIASKSIECFPKSMSVILADMYKHSRESQQIFGLKPAGSFRFSDGEERVLVISNNDFRRIFLEQICRFMKYAAFPCSFSTLPHGDSSFTGMIVDSCSADKKMALGIKMACEKRSMFCSVIEDDIPAQIKTSIPAISCASDIFVREGGANG